VVPRVVLACTHINRVIYLCSYIYFIILYYIFKT
jgi:hypothetical protein